MNGNLTSSVEFSPLVKEAIVFLNDGNADDAIDVLRSVGVPNDARICALLSQAYFQRGDTKGDVYTSHYFAGRAQQLGYVDPDVVAIQAIGAFRKEHFEEAKELLSKIVTLDSPPATKLLYGLAQSKCDKPWEAMMWIESALDTLPNDDPLAALAWRHGWKGSPNLGDEEFIPAAQNMFNSVTESLRATLAKDINSPFKYNAVSKLRGLGIQAKDFHWAKKNVPCQAACPAGTDIPGYLSAIYQGEYDRAYRINLWDNVFPGVLGRVCARPCEPACRHGWEGLGESVAICWSKRSASDFKSEPLIVLDRLCELSDKKVVVIGAGVAGLATARNLALLGHAVTVYEKHHTPGGMMNQGIPEFRLPRDIIKREIEQVRLTGVKIHCNTEIGRDISLQQLLEENDAVVMAAGTLRPNVLELPGKDLRGIRHGLDYLLEANQTRTANEHHKRVIVIGGGFTAMDCARTAWRLGAEHVQVKYRRGKNEMLITPSELEELEREDIPMEFYVSPKSYIGDEHGHVRAVQFIRTQLGEADASGRSRPIEVSGSEFEVACDVVLLATGQFPDTSWIDSKFRDLLVTKDGWLSSDATSVSNHAHIFAAGDFATGARTLIDAIGHAKECAQKVDQFLMGEKRLRDVVEVTDAPNGSGRIREMDAVPIQHMPFIPITERKLTEEVETGYSDRAAIEEAQRCYLCHYKYEIDNDKCIYCEWCIKVKPRPDCIVNVKELRYDGSGVIVGFDRAQNTEETKMIYINQEDCIRCNACVEACPVDCISVQKVSRKTVLAENA